MGASITVVITVKNPGDQVLPVADPRPGGGSLVLRVTPPGGPEQVTPMGVLVGGARAQLVNLQVLPGKSADIDFELGLYTPLDKPGPYKLVLDYTWKPGQTWRSPEMGFALDPK